MQTHMISTTSAERTPIVFVREGEVFATSRDVADYFGKDHRNALQAIDNLLKTEPTLALRNFQQGVYTLPATGSQEHRQFDMDRRGFTLLAMGFTGAKALRWKLRYIDAFETMEDEIRARTPAPPDLNDPAALRALLLGYSERSLALEQRVSELAPKEAALDRISTAKGSLCITDAAKTLQIQPKDLFAFLRANRWIYRRSGSTRDRAFEDKRLAGLLEHKITEPDRRGWTHEQVRVTPKGLARLGQVFGQRTFFIAQQHEGA